MLTESGTEIVSKIVTDGIPCLLILDIGQNIMDLSNMICMEVMYLHYKHDQTKETQFVMYELVVSMTYQAYYAIARALFKSTNLTFILPFI